MSRIGNAPIDVPKGVTINTKDKTISVKGPLGNLSFDVPDGIDFEHKDNQIKFSRASDSRTHRSLHGMARARTANMVTGCATGFTRVLEINGVGYRAAVEGNDLVLALGFSHPVRFPIPDGITMKCERPTAIAISGSDKQVVGQLAAEIRAFRPPEPFKGKGVKYANEIILRKEGKKK